MAKASRSSSINIDRRIGSLIWAERLRKGLTQEELGEIVDVTYQQIQKYETGQNRVSASRLWMIAEAMEVPCQTFFAGVERQAVSAG